MKDPGRALIPIDGLPPDLTRLPVGCPFAPRCAWATERCLEEDPALAPVNAVTRVETTGDGATHRIACWNPATDAEAAAGMPASGRISAVSARSAERAAAAEAALREAEL